MYYGINCNNKNDTLQSTICIIQQVTIILGHDVLIPYMLRVAHGSLGETSGSFLHSACSPIIHNMKALCNVDTAVLSIQSRKK